MRDIGHEMVIISFITSNTDYEVTFGNVQYQGWFPNRNENNKKIFKQDIDSLLSRMR